MRLLSKIFLKLSVEKEVSNTEYLYNRFSNVSNSDANNNDYVIALTYNSKLTLRTLLSILSYIHSA